MVGSAQVLGVGGPGGPAGGQVRFISVRGTGFLPPDRNRHGDDEREEVVVTGTLGLRFSRTPRPVRLLREMVDPCVNITLCKCDASTQ